MITITGYTEGSPCNFDDIVAADRAGTGTKLLDAGTPANNLTLTYQVRPVELRALNNIKFIVANKTAETDYIYLTGTDAWDAAQTESIDVSAGNGSYTSTKRWRTITNIDCNDNAAGGGTVWADGDLSVTQDIWGVIWEVCPTGGGTYNYVLNCLVQIGDGSTPTWFKDTKKSIFIWLPNLGTNQQFWLVMANATCTFGELFNEDYKMTRNGCMFLIYAWQNSTFYKNSGGYLYCYDCSFIEQAYHPETNSGHIFLHNPTRAWGCNFGCFGRIDRGDLYDISYSLAYGLKYSPSPCEDIRACGETVSIADYGTYRNIQMYTRYGTQCNNGPSHLIDCDPFIAYNYDLPYHWQDDGNGGIAYREWSFNLKTEPGATVSLKDINGDEVFSVEADENGDISEQIVVEHTAVSDGTSGWHNNSIITSYTPHTLTISKPGYETYQDVLNIDRKMNLNIALKTLQRRATFFRSTIGVM